jgi:hypothetical protein
VFPLKIFVKLPKNAKVNKMDNENKNQESQNQNTPILISEVPEESQNIPQKSIILFPTVILLIISSIFAGSLLYQNIQLKKALKINSFEDCAKEEGVIQESYPRVCVTKDGRKFEEKIKETPIPSPTILPTESPFPTSTNIPR